MCILRPAMSALTTQQLELFHREGYLHVPDALSSENLDPVQRELEEIVDNTARRLLAEGKIDCDYAELPFDQRLVPLCRADASGTAGINIPSNLGPGIFGFLGNDDLLDIVESIIGPEIYANSCQHLRAKLPATDDYAGNLSRMEWARDTSWHQDLGVLLPEADDTLVITTWIPLVDADESNGTLMIIPRCHNEPLRRHVKPPEDAGGNWMMAPDELPDIEPVAVPVKRGGLIIIHCRTPHGSQLNRSDRIRWSMDLRWNDARKPNGRPHLPGLYVRSREAPELVVHDREEWLTAWKFARASSRGARFYRWDA
ncbi:MAG: phytanoyl-CoA dioxygenase family protein [Candidatus Latescibacterota bacterium]|nr:phytanoyl-CoA dioxygenase family protein [Candidatus Latescibacterota bacterium]